MSFPTPAKDEAEKMLECYFVQPCWLTAYNLEDIAAAHQARQVMPGGTLGLFSLCGFRRKSRTVRV